MTDDRAPVGGEPRWDLVYKWADPRIRSLVDEVVSALENCDRKLQEAEARRAPALPLDVERLAVAMTEWAQDSDLAELILPVDAEIVAAEYDRLGSEPSDD